MTSGKPFVYPELYYLFDVLRQIGTVFGKTAARHRARGAPAVARRRAGQRRASAGGR